MIDSILAFTSYTPNNNIGMTRLRMSITSDIMNGHVRLKEMLEGTPIPPNLLTFIRHMYQNYSFDDVIDSPIIRLSYKDALCTAENDGSLNIDGSTYDEIISTMIEQSTISSMLTKIRSNWINTLPPSSYEALYDSQFSTFWHNSNIAYEDYGSAVVKFTISVKDRSEPIYYGIFGNRLDGLIYASCSIVDEHKVMENGLWAPFTEFKGKKSINCSLLQLSNDKLVRPVTAQQFRFSSMVYAAPYTMITSDKNPVWTVVHCSYAAACIPQVHSLENVTQAITKSIGWLLNP
jgi:hypothetical protein